MANIKSAKKRVLTSRVRQERNKAIKSSVKTAIKKVEAAVREADKDAAAKELLNATSIIDKAAKKGVLHKNNASRKVARLAKMVILHSNFFTEEYDTAKRTGPSSRRAFFIFILLFHLSKGYLMQIFPKST